MNNIVVKIEKSGNRFNAFDRDGVKYTSDIITSTRKSAYEAGMALEKRSGKGGRVYWWKVPMSEFEKVVIPEVSNVDIPTEVYSANSSNLLINWSLLLLHSLIYWIVTYMLQKRKDIL